jgi:hypothetical protein
MARLARIELFSPNEVAVVHVMTRVVRRCFLLGNDPLTGKNYDHRKVWVEDHLRHLASAFGIDLLCFSILSNHFHLILRSRPDCVEKWDDTEVARRWLRLCPVRKDADHRAEEPNEMELNTIRNDPDRLKLIRSRLSDLSWWMRLLCQQIAVRANHEDSETGRFFSSRYKAVRLLDEAAILACAAYVDLNPIRAAMAETLESSDYTSVQRRIQAIEQQSVDHAGLADSTQIDSSIDTATVPEGIWKSTPRESASQCASDIPVLNPSLDAPQPVAPGLQSANDAPILNPSCDAHQPAAPVADQFLSPLWLDERSDELGAVPNAAGFRCSDKGFLPMSVGDYLRLLDWTGRQLANGKRGRIPNSVAPILERLKLDRKTWCELVGTFGRRFFHVAGQPTTIDITPSRVSQQRYYIPSQTRELFQDANSRPTASV